MAVTRYADRIKFTATGNYTDERVYVKGLNWSGGADTNTLVVDDADDVEIFNFVANTGQLETGIVTFPAPVLMDEVKVTMTAGTLLVYI
jgi:hypothetical protein